jgi:hypothetical protein
VFKLTGEDTRGALDYLVCEVAPHGGPAVHVPIGERNGIVILGPPGPPPVH